MPIIVAWAVPVIITAGGCYVQHRLNRYEKRHRRASIELIQNYLEGENNGKVG
jgi:hypothetical protein